MCKKIKILIFLGVLLDPNLTIFSTFPKSFTASITFASGAGMCMVGAEGRGGGWGGSTSQLEFSLSDTYDSKYVS